MTQEAYNEWYAKHLEMLKALHEYEQALLGQAAPKRYNSVVK